MELLRRGFHIAYISANATLKPGKTWDAWYAFLTEKHGLSKKPAFVGMSRGGEYAYTWATANPGKVSCIYADNPGVNPDVLKKLGDLAAADVPLLHVCGSIDPLLGRVFIGDREHLSAIRRPDLRDDQGRGRPSSAQPARPQADRRLHLAAAFSRPAAIRPRTWAAGSPRSSFYSLENAYRYFPNEGNYITCRGPWFTPCFDRYSFDLSGVEGAINVIVPKTIAAGKPWVFRADYVSRDAVVDLALLAKGFTS